MKVLLLAGGKSNERDVSIRSGNAVEAALKQADHDVVRSDPGEGSFDLKSLCGGIDVVFLALHGAGGEDGVLQKQLEDLNVPFVGSSSEVSKLCWNKWDYKQLLLKNGIPVSEGVLVSKNDLNGEMFKKSFVLKPIEGGSTLDCLIARSVDPEKLKEAEELLNKYEQMLLESVIAGTEITVGVLGDEALPVIEIVPPDGGEFDYENKYNGESQELVGAPSVAKELQQQAQDLTLKIHQLCGCRDMSRTDIMLDKSGNMFVLETNTIPGLTDQSLLPKMAAAVDLDMPKMVDRLVKMATERR